VWRRGALSGGDGDWGGQWDGGGGGVWLGAEERGQCAQLSPDVGFLSVLFGRARGLPRERVALRAPLVALRFYLSPFYLSYHGGPLASPCRGSTGKSPSQAQGGGTSQ
jgi:hypothetical protein